MKTFKVVFKGRNKKMKSLPYTKRTVEITLPETPVEYVGVLPELNKKYDVWEIIEIWELIY